MSIVGFSGQGNGAFIVQELKNEAYLMNRVPAVRCNINNPVSKASLLKSRVPDLWFQVKRNILMSIPFLKGIC